MKLPKPTGEKCSDCKEGFLVERLNSKTTNTFLGCSEWPDCKFTKRGGVNPAPVSTYKPSHHDYDDLYDLDDYADLYSDCFGDFF